MNAPRAISIRNEANWLHRRAALGVAALLLVVDAALIAAQPWGANPQPIAADDVQLRLNPNTASAAELALLPRIGPKLAANIVAYRESVAEEPAFRTAEDLDRVERIGPATVELLRPHLVLPEIDDQPAAPQESP